MTPLTRLEPPPDKLPAVSGNGVPLIPAQYSWAGDVSNPDPSEVPIADAPARGDTVTFDLQTAVRPAAFLISAFSRVGHDGRPDPASETRFDREEPGCCTIGANGSSLTFSVRVPAARLVTLRTTFTVPNSDGGGGSAEPYSASWVVRLTP